MADARTKAANTVRYLRLPPSALERLRQERTLNVVGDSEGYNRWPPLLLARMALRAALENGCTTICVHQGVHTKRFYDVMGLVTATRAMTGGYLQAPTHDLPSNYATRSLQSMGGVFDTTRPQIAVPTTAPFPVKSPAGKE